MPGNFQIIGYGLGLLLTVMGIAQIIPALTDLSAGHPDGYVFLWGSFLSMFAGGILYFSNRDIACRMTLRQAFLIAVLGWLVTSVFAAVPLYLSDTGISRADAFFEAVSGITTTGATVLTGLDNLPRGILLWRSIMQWIGGIGVVAFAIFFLPFLRVGGMQLFGGQSTAGGEEKVMPHTNDTLKCLMLAYVILTIACALSYMTFGMTFFDAINHAMTTVSTGGFSTHDKSFGFFRSAGLEVSCTIFMVMGSLPFILFVQLFFQGRFAFWRDEQVRAFIVMMLSIAGFLTLWMMWENHMPFGRGLRLSLFNVSSIMTTTGFTNRDYQLWGPWAGALFLFLTYIGACTGSTSGGIKIMRLLVTFGAVRSSMRSLLYPHGVFPITYQDRTVNSQIVMTVLSFLCIFVLCNVILTLALGYTGLDLETSMSAAAAAIANVGPGIGKQIGPMGNYEAIPDAAKWLLSAGMLAGRLEIMAILVVFTPGFWRD